MHRNHLSDWPRVETFGVGRHSSAERGSRGSEVDAVDGMRLAPAQGCEAVKFFVLTHADLGSRFDALTISMTTEHELREKLRKISALFEGATTVGERHAAAAAIDRIRKALAVAARTEQPVETQFTLSDQWSRRLFTALCRRYGLEPYRYRRQRHTTVVVQAPRSFISNTLWPEFLQIKDALDEYLNEATERIIREEVYGNSAEAPERAE